MLTRNTGLCIWLIPIILLLVPRFTPTEIAGQLSASGARLVVGHSSIRDKLQAATSILGAEGVMTVIVGPEGQYQYCQ